MGIFLCATLLLGLLGLAVDSDRAERDFAGLVRGLIAAPTNVSLQNAILARIHRSRYAHLPEAASETVYEIALYALAKNSLPAARNFALDIGRWHFGRCRPGKNLTASDEQAIQKHVLACCR